MTQIQNIRKNCMGTASFEMKLDKMRKFQEFIVYPMQSGDENKRLTIQSDTRIGLIDIKTGAGLMSKSHSSGAYFPHLQCDPLDHFLLSDVDLAALKMFIFTTQGEAVGKNALSIRCDNSQAVNIFDL